jgi:hypothetical protein
MLMGLYRSAELGRTEHFPDPELERCVPQVARPNGAQPEVSFATASTDLCCSPCETGVKC